MQSQNLARFGNPQNERLTIARSCRQFYAAAAHHIHTPWVLSFDEQHRALGIGGGILDLVEGCQRCLGQIAEEAIVPQLADQAAFDDRQAVRRGHRRKRITVSSDIHYTKPCTVLNSQLRHRRPSAWPLNTGAGSGYHILVPTAAPLRSIFHLDMDAFFVSVEELSDPQLRGKAVVVGGQRDERGVVSSASYEARKFGVHSAMPLRTAAKQCPHAIFVDGHPERYRECSEEVYKILGTFTPQVEMASIDEAYLDMTGTERLHGPALKAAHNLHQRMKA